MPANPHPHDIFDALEISADPFALCELAGRCSLGMGRDAGASVHYVLAGSGRFEVEGAAAMPLEPGTLVFVPAGRRHALRAAGPPGPAARPAPLPECRAADLRLAHLREGAGDDRLIALCGHVTLGLRGSHGLVDLLHDPVAVTVDAVPHLGHAVEALLDELSRPGPGSRAMVRALLTQAVIALLRARPGAGLMRLAPLLADGRLWRAVQAMLDDPGAPHRLEALAETAGMSRSAFAARFAALCGQPPAAFLRELRLARAAALLAMGEGGVDRIAARAGFASRSAFSRAFRARYGHPPAALRGPEGPALAPRAP